MYKDTQIVHILTKSICLLNSHAIKIAGILQYLVCHLLLHTTS